MCLTEISTPSEEVAKKVEDLGGEDAEPSEEVAKKASAKGLGRSASDRR